MRIFLITFAVSVSLSLLLWQFGLASRIWPEHPLLATLAIAILSGIAVQLILSRDASAHKLRKHN